MTFTISEIDDRLFRIDTPLGGRVVSLYLVRGDDSCLLFDTGVRGTIPEYLIPALESISVAPSDIGTVVISHCDADHFGGIVDARAQLPNARLLAHAADRPAMEDYPTFLRERGDGFSSEYGLDEDPAVLNWIRSVTGGGPIDGDAHEGQTFDLGGIVAEMWHVPGHTNGHLAVAIQQSSAVLVADAVLGESVDLADGTPAFPPTYRHVADYRATIARLRDAAHELLLTAHYPTMRNAAATEFLDLSASFANGLEAQVLSAVADHPNGITLQGLLEILNPIAGRWPSEGTAGALAYPVAGHLEDLEHRGALQRIGSEGRRPLWATT